MWLRTSNSRITRSSCLKKMQISGSCLNLPESKYRVETKDLQIVRWLRGKESTCQCRRHGFNPWVRRFLGEGSGNHLQYSCLGNPIDGGAWQTTVHKVAKSWTGLSVQTTTVVHKCCFCFQLQTVKSRPAVQETRVQSLSWEDPLKKEMATYFSILAWKIPWWRILVGYSP